MKKMILVLLTFLGEAVLASPANMQTVVNKDSGEMLYACNARIRHPGGEELECVNLSTGESCSPEKAADDGTSCVCRSRSNWGDQIQASTVFNKTQIAMAGPDWAYLQPMDRSFDNKLSEIDISLGSERLGAEYAITFCYVGPKEMMKKKTRPEEQDQDLSEGRYQLDVSLAGVNYGRSLADIRFLYSCDLRSSGQQLRPRDANDLIPSGGLPEDDAGSEVQILGAGSGSSEVSFSKTSIFLNTDFVQVPRFCVFEFRFKELSKGFRDAVGKSTNFSGKLRICKQGGSCP